MSSVAAGEADDLERRARGRRLALIVVLAIVAVVVIVGIEMRGDRDVRANVSEAVPEIDAILERAGRTIVSGYPSNSDEVYATFDRVHGVTLVAVTKFSGSLRLAFEARRSGSARCVRYTVAPDGRFGHDVVDGGC